MSDAVRPIIAKLEAGAPLEDDEISAAFNLLMSGAVAQEDIKAFLSLTRAHMGDPRLIAGAARAMRARMISVAAPAGAIDVCGTGGDGAHTLNISTAVAFVLAGAGVPVAKHGNRAMSSKTGGADVLEALGVKITSDARVIERCFAEANIAFLFAQHHHPATRYVAAARRELGGRTIFNLLGPLTNPAGVTRQLTGVFEPALVRPMAEALGALGAHGAWVVHGAGGLDELAWSQDGVSHVAMLEDGVVSTLELALGQGVGPAPAGDLRGGDAEFNAQALRALLSGESANEAYRIAVEINAAAAFVVAGLAKRLQDGMVLAHHYLGAGAGRHALEALIAATRRAP